MTFHGWTDAALDFYEGLEVDNSRAYWHSHKNVYDEQVLGPMRALLAELSDEFGEAKVFRPHRDIRFSSDKTPYKTQVGATLAGHGYVQLSADGLAVASGNYVFAADQLARYRRAVALDLPGQALAKIVRRCPCGRTDHHLGRHAHDGTARLSEGSRTNRAAADEGPGHLEAVADRTVVGHGHSEGQGRRRAARLDTPGPMARPPRRRL